MIGLTNYIVPEDAAVTEEKIRAILSFITDPEVPVLSIIDLGIVRKIFLNGDGVEISITPTYTACPAIDMISTNIRMEMAAQGYKNVIVKFVLSPAWTTEWMSKAGKKKLRAYGIAPPQSNLKNISQARIDRLLFEEDKNIECPLCNSVNTRLISQFGSTACKALYQCLACLEPFDYFKCH